MSCCMHEAIVAILVEGVPASPAALEIVPGSPGVSRAPRSPEVAALAEAASPAVREGSGLAEPPGIQLERKGRVRPSASAAERQAQRKRPSRRRRTARASGGASTLGGA